ncbi:acetyltransferase [Colletotrichum graminicola]|uniref:Acetyltransferase n=1 Tax=Colletotrichum graminicola (strain M1.001 / M2 / FGSC 10212) TaxID=645133 RepID=E3QI61_COLGM|nr:acetyltransferase [Colletotrichum graminicola M1.001]EFQ30676.1 acetyltransferase [Colletotrichum graminicola M1.001]WDK21412.1 acetyltransferase [Colletotrichum graminicola]
MANIIPLNFRVAKPEDAPKIQQLVQAAFRAEDSRADWTADMELGRSFQYSVEEVLKTINNPDAAIIMASDENGVLLGSIGIIKCNDNLARFAMLSVDPEQQCGGIGRRVLAYAEDFARNWNLRTFGLNALSSREKLIAWYERCGYKKSGETSPFPVDQLPQLNLPKDLCFVELEKDTLAEELVVRRS